MECKVVIDGEPYQLEACINRNIVECKVGRGTDEPGKQYVLIET